MFKITCQAANFEAFTDAIVPVRIQGLVRGYKIASYDANIEEMPMKLVDLVNNNIQIDIECMDTKAIMTIKGILTGIEGKFVDKEDPDPYHTLGNQVFLKVQV